MITEHFAILTLIFIVIPCIILASHFFGRELERKRWISNIAEKTCLNVDGNRYKVITATDWIVFGVLRKRNR